jgi:holo-[acyl-carrier protein] synthase
MKIKTGCDIVEIKRFKNMQEAALKKIFHPTEIRNKPESLAGIFAAKEAVKKVFNELSWHDIEIKKEKGGKPTLVIQDKKDVASHDISISHDGKYAFATAVFLLKK